MPTESLGPHWFGAMTPVLLVVVVPTMVRVVARASPLPCIAKGTSAGFEGVVRITVAAKMLLNQNHDAWPATVRCLVDARWLALSSRC